MKNYAGDDDNDGDDDGDDDHDNDGDDDDDGDEGAPHTAHHDTRCRYNNEQQTKTKVKSTLSIFLGQIGMAMTKTGSELSGLA